MRISNGKVVDGRVVVDGEPLEEGANVTILITDERTFYLNSAEERELLDAIAEADRGDLLDADEVLKEIR